MKLQNVLDFNEVMESFENVRQSIPGAGATPLPHSPNKVEAFIRTETQHYGRTTIHYWRPTSDIAKIAELPSADVVMAKSAQEFIHAAKLAMPGCYPANLSEDGLRRIATLHDFVTKENINDLAEGEKAYLIEKNFKQVLENSDGVVLDLKNERWPDDYPYVANLDADYGRRGWEVGAGVVRDSKKVEKRKRAAERKKKRAAAVRMDRGKVQDLITDLEFAIFKDYAACFNTDYAHLPLLILAADQKLGKRKTNKILRKYAEDWQADQKRVRKILKPIDDTNFDLVQSRVLSTLPPSKRKSQ